MGDGIQKDSGTMQARWDEILPSFIFGLPPNDRNKVNNISGFLNQAVHYIADYLHNCHFWSYYFT